MCLSWYQTAGALVRSWAMSMRRGTLDPLRAAMSVKPRVGLHIRTGISIYRREEAHAIVRAALERGFAVATHAIGNDAIDIAVSAYESAGSALGRVGLPRLEHGTFLSRELVARIAGVGAAVVTQPHFVSLPAYDSAASIPGLKNAPLRWLLDAGVKVAGSSDFPVAGFDPLDGIRGAIRRRTAGGRLYEPEQRSTKRSPSTPARPQRSAGPSIAAAPSRSASGPTWLSSTVRSRRRDSSNARAYEPPWSAETWPTRPSRRNIGRRAGHGSTMR
jgi:predicted amidohydrolase YtcJ